jgi:septal ring factor EnvC (AmiA/AmiB activator)
VGEVCNEIVCVEKFKNLEKDIDQLKTQQEKLEERLTSNEKQVSQIDNQLSIKLIQLEAKLDVHTKIVGEKVITSLKKWKRKWTNISSQIILRVHYQHQPQTHLGTGFSS